MNEDGNGISREAAYQEARNCLITELCGHTDWHFAASSLDWDSARVLGKYAHMTQSQDTFGCSKLRDRYKGKTPSQVTLTVAEFLSENAGFARRGISKSAHPAPAPETLNPVILRCGGGRDASFETCLMPRLPVLSLLCPSIMDS